VARELFSKNVRRLIVGGVGMRGAVGFGTRGAGRGTGQLSTPPTSSPA